MAKQDIKVTAEWVVEPSRDLRHEVYRMIYERYGENGCKKLTETLPNTVEEEHKD